MAYYRLYLLTADTGRIESFTEIHAEDDSSAVTAATAQAGDAPFELWCGGRKVHTGERGAPGGGQRAA